MIALMKFENFKFLASFLKMFRSIAGLYLTGLEHGIFTAVLYTAL